MRGVLQAIGRLRLALALVALALSVALLIHATWNVAELTVGKQPTDTSLIAIPLRSVPEVVAVPLEQYTEFKERPIFNQTRRPAPPKTAPIAAAPPLPPALPTPAPPPPPELRPMILVGVIFSEASRVALVKVPNASGVTPLYAGQFVDGWKVREIEEDRVVFSRDREQREIKFPPNGPRTSVPQSAATQSPRPTRP